MIEDIKDIITQEVKAIYNIPIDDTFERAIDLIIERVHKNKGKIITSGMGKAGQIALNIATTFSSTGTCAVYLHPAEAQHGDLGVIQPEDLLLIVSNSGNTRECIELMNLTDRLHPTVDVIGITGNDKSELYLHSNVCLMTGGSPEICPLGLTPTTSTTLMTIIGDILVVETMKKIGFTKEEYNKRHHGGYLGKMSKN